MACTVKISVCGEDITCKEPFRVASDKVAILFAKFTIKGEWSYPVVRAIFQNDYGVSASILVVDNECEIPPEVLRDEGEVRVGLVATESEDSLVVKQMTSHTALCVIVDEKVRTEADNSIHPTGSEFDQFVDQVSNLLHFGVTDETLIIGESVNARVEDDMLIIEGDLDEN